MPKEVALSKRAKISRAQQNVLLAVLGSAIFLGIAIALVLHFVNQITYNADVIAAEERAIVVYSDTIKDIGVCPAPKGRIYSNDELKKCDPNTVEVSSVPGTLRYNILEDMAASRVLNSVPQASTAGCVNPATEKRYTFTEMNNIYNDATTSEERVAATALIRSCSALRVIPDALPSSKNEEALMSSLNKIFILSGREPESLSPTGESDLAAFGSNLNAISLRLSLESDADGIYTFLVDSERSIREFDILKATIEKSSDSTLSLSASALAYYMDPSTIIETTETVTKEGAK